jgi:hypothetical protein
MTHKEEGMARRKKKIFETKERIEVVETKLLCEFIDKRNSAKFDYRRQETWHKIVGTFKKDGIRSYRIWSVRLEGGAWKLEIRGADNGGPEEVHKEGTFQKDEAIKTLIREIVSEFRSSDYVDFHQLEMILRENLGIRGGLG